MCSPTLSGLLAVALVPFIDAEVVVVEIVDMRSASVMSESVAGEGDLESVSGDAEERWDVGARTEKLRASWEMVEGAEARFDDSDAEDAV